MSEKLDLEPLAKSLLDNKFVGVLLVADNKIEFANQFCESLFGIDLELISKSDFSSLLEFDREGNSLARLIKLGDDVIHRGAAIHKSGSKHPVNISVNSTSKQYTAVFISPTYDRESFIFLKRQFFKRVTHELRSPLSSIVGALALLSSGKLSKVDNILKIAERNSKRLTLMINSILDIEVFEGGSLVLQETANDLQELLSTSIELVQEYAHENNVELELKGCPVEVISDYERLPQAVAQLINFLITNNSNITKITITLTDSDGWADVKLTYLEGSQSEKDMEENPEESSVLLPSFTIKMAREVIDLHKGTITGLEDDLSEIWIRLPISTR